MLGTFELNRIYQMDCVEGMKMLPDDCIDLTVTSPPYDNLREYKGYSFNFEQTALELYRVTKPGGVVVWIVGDETIKGDETGTSFRQALYFKECGFRLADTMIYHKTDVAFPRFGHKKYPAAFEYMFVLSKGPIKTFNLIRDRPNKLVGQVMSGTVRQSDGTVKPSRANGKTVSEFGARSNVWGYSTGKGKSASDAIAFNHPAIFPEKLANDHILSWSNEGDIVLDPFMGSGTTAKMAQLNKRKWIGFEIAPEYVELANKRLLNGGRTA
ncbi:DNA-methyltransferase [Brevibacillus borstelensis]|uniref:DNA-methyltransferase n=1 Tax=Brevibacillus borstelensis TaxID=45462 RepID=UPI00287FB483|nr:site-specific DNA-methyltransferase [Brevibacillus borstelensis]WNF07431.1 site-specific DNA-methyltransferase [Brevibacillus borstelensis]